ncbi:MAG: TonB-dependent receptor [Chthoniobacterales bacterium]|nr:TonB-dependent receptor [Chthoniobacterales bacterium]
MTRDTNGDITFIELAFENGGSQKARGFDVALQYQMETSVGTFNSLTQATYLDSFQSADLPGVPELELRSSGSDDAYLKWKANSQLSWTWRGLSLSGTLHYLDGFHEHDLNGLIHYVRQTWIFDLQASYDLGRDIAKEKWFHILRGTTITVGCNNVFGKDPPTAATSTNYPGALYDSTGRFIYLSLTKKF